jgi:hypothetical protein
MTFNDLCVTSWNFYFFQGSESSCFAHADHLYHFIACFASFTSAENRQLYCLFAGYILVMLIKNCHSNKRIIDTFIWQDWCLVNCKLRENDGLRNWITYKEHLVFCFLWNEEVQNLADWCFCNFSESTKEKGRVIFLCNMTCSMPTQYEVLKATSQFPVQYRCLMLLSN